MDDAARSGPGQDDPRCQRRTGHTVSHGAVGYRNAQGDSNTHCNGDTLGYPVPDFVTDAVLDPHDHPFTHANPLAESDSYAHQQRDSDADPYTHGHPDAHPYTHTDQHTDPPSHP